MAVMGRIRTGYGPSSPQTRLSCQTLSLVSPSFTLGAAGGIQNQPGHWECPADPTPFPSVGIVPAAVPSSAEPWLSRACSDVQKFLPPNCGWMWRLCDTWGCLSMLNIHGCTPMVACSRCLINLHAGTDDDRG